MTTKIHALVEGLGNLGGWKLTGGQAHDCTQACPLLEVADTTNTKSVTADKAYDTDEILTLIENKIGAEAVIPSKANRREQRPPESRAVQEPQPYRTVLLPTEAVSPHRHALRQACEPFQRIHRAGGHLCLACLTKGPQQSTLRTQATCQRTIRFKPFLRALTLKLRSSPTRWPDSLR